MTTLIKNVLVVDGSGRPPFKGDVLVRGNRIMAVGNLPRYKADDVIYGNELYCAPGFIDIHNTSDRHLSLFSSPEQKDSVLQGVTTIVMGHRGFSLAPVLYKNLHRFTSWARVNHVNIDWVTVKDFLTVLERRFSFGVNVASLVGHKTVREDIAFQNGEFTSLTSNELRVMRSLIDSSLSDGVFGISFGLGDFPYTQTSYHELRALCDVVTKYEGFCSVFLREEKAEAMSSVKEIVRLSQDVKIACIISNLRPFVGYKDVYEQAREYIESYAHKARVYFSANPFSQSVNSIESFLPHDVIAYGREHILSLLREENGVKALVSRIPHLDGKKIIIIRAPHNEFLQGKTLYEFAQSRSLSVSRAFVELMRITQLHATLLCSDIDEKQNIASLFSPQALISSQSSSFDALLDQKNKPQASTSTFPTFLNYAHGASVPVEKAIHHITGLPASLLGFSKRGIISVGNFADIVLFGADGKPMFVMVNGSVVVRDGEYVSTQASGVVLKRGAV